jgi:hypothetical protein
MAYFARKVGLACYKAAKTNKDTECIICEEIIKRGQMRYVTSGRANMCILCYNQWDEVGGLLGQIPRCKHKIQL